MGSDRPRARGDGPEGPWETEAGNKRKPPVRLDRVVVRLMRRWKSQNREDQARRPLRRAAHQEAAAVLRPASLWETLTGLPIAGG